MRSALQLARRNLGQTWPNPAVGALIVKNGQIVGEGWTALNGRPHAETEALSQAGEAAKGATIYVTLEPCSHHGKTPPCADAIIAAGIAKVVIGCGDPNPEVNGNGIAKLKKAGIEVIENICESEAREVNRGFISVMERKRPYVALKIATSHDDKIAGSKERWITGERARAYGHMLRSRYDAIATGIGTVLADDPLLTCRLPGLEDCSPVRVLFDRKGRLPKNAKLAPDYVLNAPLPQAMENLAGKGITRLLVEAGQQLSTAFMESGFVDRIYWFRAPTTIGEGGLAAFGSSVTLANWQKTKALSLGKDTLEIYEKLCSPAS